MDENFPKDFSITLPNHVVANARSREAQICDGKEATDPYIDVGLWYGNCPKCRETFVFIRSKNIWMVESEFEKALIESPPQLKSFKE